MSWSARTAAKAKCKVDKALYKCEMCGWLVYEGSSPVTYDYYLQVYGSKVLYDNFHMDHKEPVVPLEGLGQPPNYDWNIHFTRLFCAEENWQGICKTCHDKKTKSEQVERKKIKSQKK